MPRKYDFVSIGGGSAGFNAARVAAGLGLRTAVVDGAPDLGGLCILRGCMPSKTLIYSAEVLHLAREARAFGLRVRGVSADMGALHRRKLEVIGDFAGHRVRQLEGGPWDLYRSRARFTDPHTLLLDDGRRIRSSHFLIGTGSRVSVPPLPGLASTPFWTSDEVLDLDFVPESVLVLGGGIVACELAQFLRRIGSRVTLVQRSGTLLRGHSEEAAGVVRAAFEAEGIEVLTGTRIVRVASAGPGVSVAFEQGGRTRRRRAAHLFNALGREPDTASLGLPSAGVATTPGGRVLANRWQQTSAPHIYAAGDCCGPHEIVHIAIQQAELAARHAAGLRGLRPLDESLLLSVVFTDPQVASIGWSEAGLAQRKAPHLSASYPFDDHGKSILMNARRGYVRVTADPDRGRILGAEVVGKDAGELIHCLTGPISMRATVHDLLRAPWYHPTLAEIITYPLEEIAGKLPARSGRR
jgi:pyruvate/2-oxoglutarate dehydrogenase complex dihydrolipoamide dehydrogenase (E3) component